MHTLSARYILSMDKNRIFENASLIFDEKKIIDIHSTKAHTKIQNIIILPAFINAHSHLELSFDSGKNFKAHNFTTWLQEVKYKREFVELEFKKKQCEKAIQELLSSGVLAIGDISSDHFVLDILKKYPLKGRVYLEYIALDPLFIKKWSNICTYLKRARNKNGMALGICLHSPYTISPKAFLYLQESLHSLSRKIKLCIHLSESSEENLFFSKHKAPLFNWISSFESEFKKLNKMHPINYFFNYSQIIDRQPLLIHVNNIQKEHILMIKEKKLSIVHCPRSYNFFKHPQFPIKKILEAKIPIAIGTDSLMSNINLNFFDELRMLKKTFPFLKAHEILKMATLNGAKALYLKKGWGIIQKTKPYAFIVLKIPSNARLSKNSICDFILNTGNKIERFFLSKLLQN